MPKAKIPVSAVTRASVRARLATLVLLAGAVAPLPALAQSGATDAATVAELRRQMQAMQQRLDQLEAALARKATAEPARQKPARPAQAVAAPATMPQAAAPIAAPVPAVIASPGSPPTPLITSVEASVPGLLPPEPMGNSFEDALRSDLPGIAFRVPGADTQVRLYGFAKVSGYFDAGPRNQTDAPLPGGIPLTASRADRQGGEFSMSGRFSRFGVDTRTLTDWGTLETRIEGDFGGGSPTTSNAVFRLRQAWAELGNERFRVLAGQANSLWNEGLFETLIDATNLNQSFIRQAQLRATFRVADGLTGQVSLEAPDTQFTSANGVTTPDSSSFGSPSPAFNGAPDLLGRLTWRQDGLELGGRAMLRQLQMKPGTDAVPAPVGDRSATGWGLAAHARLPLRWVAEGFGPDELLAMGYYGEGIGRYFPAGTNGQDAVSNLGLANAGGLRFDTVPAWGATLAYRRFWTPTLRSHLTYAYARQDFPSYTLGFTPGSASAIGLNRDVQQVFANLIWSPFGSLRDGLFGAGWLDVGVEYVFTRRDVYGGAAATGPAGVGHGIGNRIVFATIARF